MCSFNIDHSWALQKKEITGLKNTKSNSLLSVPTTTLTSIYSIWFVYPPSILVRNPTFYNSHHAIDVVLVLVIVRFFHVTPCAR